MESVRPLAPRSERQRLGEGDPSQQSFLKKHILMHRCIFCAILCITTSVFLGLLVLILILTAFRIKEPKIQLNSVIIDNLQINSLTSAVNMSARADVTVKNPNVVTFIFKNTTSSVIYHGRTVGNAISPSGKARAKRSMHMNVSLIVMADNLAADKDFANELAVDTLPVTTFTRLKGKMKILHILKKHVKLTLKCNLNISVSTQSILGQNCKQKMKI